MEARLLAAGRGTPLSAISFWTPQVDACNATHYFSRMVCSFRHKGLRRLYEDNDASKLPPDMVERIRRMLSFLDAADRIEDMDQPTFRLHALKGDLKGFWAVTVRANWRMIFRFEDGDAFDVDFLDYH
jgi:proteic killer suppression protein